jgi:hypothetical protein
MIHWLVWFTGSRRDGCLVLDSGPNGNRLYMRIATRQQSDSAVFFQEKSGSWIYGWCDSRICYKFDSFVEMQKKTFQGYNNWWQWKSHGILVCTNKELNQNTFSEKLGEGGFGCVFEEVLPGCTTVAVKKLKCLRQEDKTIPSRGSDHRYDSACQYCSSTWFLH